MTADVYLHVAVGVIKNSRNQVLLSYRATSVDQPDLWEFPGGKLESGETVTAGLARELYEELGIKVEAAHPLIKIYHDYDAYSVLLDVWCIDTWVSDSLDTNDTYGQEGQKLEWVDISMLDRYAFPQANKPIVKAVQLPEFYLICPRPGKDVSKYINTFKQCISAGVRLFQLRFGDESVYEHYKTLITELLELCQNSNSRLLLNSSADYALRAGVHGVHLNSSRLLKVKTRPDDDNFLVAASCHDAYELEHACSINLDFAVLSPVQRTASHPKVNPMGWDKFKNLVTPQTIPIYALGGMQYEDLKKSLEYGGQGISVLSGIWNTGDVANALKKYLQR